MDHDPDVADCQPERVASSHDNLQDRIARISNMDPTLLSHDLFCGDDSSSSNLIKRPIIEQPSIDTDTTQSGFVSQARRESDDCTNHEISSLRLLDTRTPDELSQSPSEVEYGHHDSTAPWLPFYLRRTTSLLFLAIFAIMIVILETLFTLSLRNSGLSTGTTSMRYLWSYGTTGTLTLTAAFWHRLDYEEKIAAPWFKAIPVTSSKAALLVDYIDAWSLLVPFRAFRNQDYKVACSSMVSLLLQLVIVLSTALFVLSSTNSVNDAEPIWLTSRFVDDPMRLINGDSLLPYYIAMRSALPSLIPGLNASIPNSAYTEGYTDQFAYGTFDPVSSDLLEVKAVVEGLTMDLTCEPASVGKTVVMPKILYYSDASSSTDGGSPYFEIKYQGCQTSIDWPGFLPQHVGDIQYGKNNKTVHGHGMILRHVPGFARNQCHSEDKGSHRLVLLSGEVEWRTSDRTIMEGDGQQCVAVSIDAIVTRAVAMACTPSLNQELLEVSRNSEGVRKVSQISGQTADILKNIHPWDLIDYILNTRGHLVLQSDEDQVDNTTALIDEFSQLLLSFCGQSCQAPPELLNSAFLERILASFLSSHVAATAHALLRESTRSPSIATSTSTREHLWVQPIVCQGMAGVLSTVIFLVLAMNFEHKKSFARRIRLGSIAATVVLSGNVTNSQFSEGIGNENSVELAKWLNRTLQSQDSTNSPLNTCSSSQQGIARERKGCKIIEWMTASSGAGFSDPLPLRSVSHVALFVAIAVCSITLASLLQKSDDEQGLGEGADSKYRLYAWTTAPAFILTVVSWWLSSIDIQVRILSPYNSLKRKRFGVDILQLNLLRGLVPSVLYWELKTSNFAAVTTTIAALLGATLTTASAAIFHVVIYTVARPIALSPSTVFTTIPVHSIVWGSDPHNPAYMDYSTAGRMSSLILEANLSYPQEVYRDLVFPTLSVIPHEIENASPTTNLSSSTISLTIPALRPKLSCRMYSQADLTAVYGNNSTFMWIDNPGNGISVNITTEKCNSYRQNWTAFFENGDRSEFLFGAISNNDIQVYGCSEHIYIWGYHNSTPGPVTNISAFACNSSVELVHATVSLFEKDLSLDLSNAPRAIETTARYIQEYGTEYGPVDDYSTGRLLTYLASLATRGDPLFDTFFQQLVTSRYAIPISAIGDPAQSQAVIDAIKLQYGVIYAQFLSANYRIDIMSPNITDNKTNVLMPSLFYNATSGKPVEIPASLTYPFGRHRVTQDPIATAILEILLLSILILSILGWWLHPTEAALPRSPTSVASVLALLAGGNLLEHVYDGSPEPLCWEDLESRLGKDSRFYLGWDPSTSGKSSPERRFGIWMINERNQE